MAIRLQHHGEVRAHRWRSSHQAPPMNWTPASSTGLWFLLKAIKTIHMFGGILILWGWSGILNASYGQCRQLAWKLKTYYNDNLCEIPHIFTQSSHESTVIMYPQALHQFPQHMCVALGLLQLSQCWLWSVFYPHSTQDCCQGPFLW